MWWYVQSSFALSLSLSHCSLSFSISPSLPISHFYLPLTFFCSPSFYISLSISLHSLSPSLFLDFTLSFPHSFCLTLSLVLYLFLSGFFIPEFPGLITTHIMIAVMYAPNQNPYIGAPSNSDTCESTTCSMEMICAGLSTRILFYIFRASCK